MFVFLFFFVIFLTLLGLLSSNVIVWWSVFLLMTVVFIMLNKSVGNYSSVFNYFVIQEVLGLFFLIMYSSFYQFFIVVMKIGVSPLHFWVFSVVNGVFGFNLMWFLTFQKLPFLVILLQLFWMDAIFFLVVGLLVCYFQMFLLKSYKNLIVISSTESFNWMIMGLLFSFFNSLFLFLYYVFLMLLLIAKYSKQSLNFTNWETVLVFLNIPFSVSFFVKIFSLSEVLKLDSFMIMFLLFLMFLSILSFVFWLINLSMKSNLWLQNNNKMLYFMIIPLTLICVI
uniref:NADH dehydrogenase subunit 2 n=1 Tax=Rhabdias kafunata TaxID=2605646 RepID=UPI0023D81485|nr:NADH dehydrogenase subunit 2 [Rhabdias kafunata]WCQ82421.1 NADH dehydrogenase subunit 2 [Rhabdias kafunata]